MNDVPLVLKSDLSRKRPVKFLKVRLRGTVSNRDGLGATVKVITPERTLTQFHDGKSGHLAQSSLPLYFGLGDTAKVTRIEALWPSGAKQIVSENLSINSAVELVEPRP
jgi:hypothetical protein